MSALLGLRSQASHPSATDAPASSEHAGSVATHDHLMREAWGAAHLKARQYLHILVRKIRRKIEGGPTQPKRLINKVGVGYGLA